MTGTPETPFALTELLDYQEHGIVSRIVLKKPSGSVTLFAFDQGEELSEHTAPFDALVHVLEGEADVRVGTERHHVAAGAMLLLPAGVPHAVAAHERFKMLLTMLRT